MAAQLISKRRSRLKMTEGHNLQLLNTFQPDVEKPQAGVPTPCTSISLKF